MAGETPARIAAYFRLEDGGARCELCPNMCLVLPDRAGRCRVRTYQEGKGLVTTSYGNVGAIALDPIEKKPLFHFYPGTTILSLGSFGCNLRCRFCQNWHISQTSRSADRMTPQAVVDLAKKYRSHRCIGVAFTYNEPTIWYEFIQDTASLLETADLKTVLVTNGYMASGPWRELMPHVDAVNIDVKAWSDEFYREMCGGSRQPVLDNAEIAGKYCHVELTYLIIPGLNDDMGSLEGFAQWVRNMLGRETPVHFSRYFPNYLLEIPATPIASIEKAREIAGRWLDYVYIGNVQRTDAANTYCPACHGLVIQRNSLEAPRIHAIDERCPSCGQALPLTTSL